MQNQDNVLRTPPRQISTTTLPTATGSPFAKLSQAQEHVSYSKVFNDPLAGHITVEPELIEFIDTPQFQRLRDLKQLGSCYYVFPGATHNRFEHCIGASHLAGVWLDELKSKTESLEVNERERMLIKIAALTHDLGHGPFSHVFDNEFIPRTIPNCSWTHEDASMAMLDYLVDDNHIDIESHEVKFVKKLIHEGPAQNEERQFLYQIVANHKNSIDVDKFDYLARDCHNLGVKYSYDSSRLMKMSRVINGDICFNAKEVYNLYEMFHTRYTLHKQIYSHRVGKQIEYMITDALVAANPVFKISDAIGDMEHYMQLTDCILKQIETTKDSRLEKSQQILKRLRKRELYKFVDEVLMEPAYTRDKFKVTEQEIVNHQDPNSHLTSEDIIIHDLKINYAMKDKNPVDHVLFYRNDNTTHSFPINKRDVSLLIPEHFEERCIRLYCRHPEKTEDARKAFINYISNSNHPSFVIRRAQQVDSL